MSQTWVLVQRVNDIAEALFGKGASDLVDAVEFISEPGMIVPFCNILDDDRVQVGLPMDASDEVIAHELGHAYACWRWPELSHKVDYFRHETVAFACEAWYALGREADREFIAKVLSGRPGFLPRA